MEAERLGLYVRNCVQEQKEHFKDLHGQLMP